MATTRNRTSSGRTGGDPYSPWKLQDGWRLNSRSERTLLFRHGETERAVVVGYGDDGYHLTLDGITEIGVPPAKFAAAGLVPLSTAG